jgi:putative transposase
MDERLKVIARLLDGEKMAQLCREFGVSRKPSSGGSASVSSPISSCRAPAPRNDPHRRRHHSNRIPASPPSGTRNSPKIDAFMQSVLQA